ncbi:phosphatase PAP2 family protein, partial [Aeromicrobium sp.]|uniref:phosphatase PAP2 family protein n=1 Tax=Aeromicrobium sp. TaxID=1871063 RepID=UPI003C64BA14
VVARRAGFPRPAQWFLRVFLVLTILATVYFGWHYVSDVIVGLLLGFVGAWVGEQFAAPDQPLDAEAAVERSQLGASDLAGRSTRQ